jgi:hypothetical protein
VDEKGRRLVLGEARRWVDLGLIDAQALPRIEALYGGDPGPGFVQLVLLDLAGAVLGAAIIALVSVVLRLNGGSAALTLGALGTGALAAGGAAAAWGGRPAWADTLLTAGAIAYAFMAFPDPQVGKALAILALLGGLALPFLGHRQGAVGALGAALFMAAGFAFMMRWFASPGFIFDQPTRAGATLYLLLAAAYLGGLGYARQRLGRQWPGATGVAALAFVVPLGFFLDAVVLRGNVPQGSIQILIAVGEGLLLAAGFGLRDRALVVGASIGVAGAAVAFAFDVGGPVLGVVVLLLVAAALVGLAFAVRRDGSWWERDAPAA